jgi:hypothetical protein
MTNLEPADLRITAEMRAKYAYIYIRQSSLGQVTHNTESTDLQYQLVERAVQFGWPRDRVRIIDDDLGNQAPLPTTVPAFSNSLPISVWRGWDC